MGTGGPRKDAIPLCHKVLTFAGVLGRLWDRQKSEKENTVTQYEPTAIETLKKCGVAIPPELAPDMIEIEVEDWVEAEEKPEEKPAVTEADEPKIAPLSDGLQTRDGTFNVVSDNVISSISITE